VINPLRGVVPNWLIVGTLALIGAGVAVLVGFGIQQLAFYGDAPQVTSAPTHSARPTTSSTPSPSPSQSAAPKRTTPVSVFNATEISGLAARTLDQVVAFGWPRGVSGNWQDSISETTVYYPPGAEDEGHLLAEDLGITRVQPNLPGMKPDRLVIVLTAPPASEQ
jgi:hypothetical protein